MKEKKKKRKILAALIPVANISSSGCPFGSGCIKK